MNVGLLIKIKIIKCNNFSKQHYCIENTLHAQKRSYDAPQAYNTVNPRPIWHSEPRCGRRYEKSHAIASKNGILTISSIFHVTYSVSVLFYTKILHTATHNSYERDHTLV